MLAREKRSTAIRRKNDTAKTNMYSLVVCIPYPREGTEDGDNDEDICSDSSDEDGVMRILVVDED